MSCAGVQVLPRPLFPFWLQKTLSRAYELSGTEQPVPAPRARETRGIAPSLLFKKNFAVD